MPEIIRGNYRGNKFPGNELFQHYCYRLSRAFANVKRPSKKRERFVDVFRVLEERSCVFDEFPISHGKLIPVLIELVINSNADWVRDPEDWQPAGFEGCAQVQLRSFIGHVSLRYLPPRFFLSLFANRDWAVRREYQWYLHIGRGGNIRTAPDLPTVLTKKAAHFMMQAPDDLSVCEAFLWGEMKCCEAGDDLIREVLKASPIANEISRVSDYYWQERTLQNYTWLLDLVRIMVRTPNLDLYQVGPVIDFVFDTRVSLKGRTMNSLIRRMEEWHEAINRRRVHRYYDGIGAFGESTTWLKWKGLRGAFYISDEPGKCGWQFVELLSARELADEGRVMNHCVGTYVHQCKIGNSSIWSLRCLQPTGMESAVTIEVQKTAKGMRIAQARAERNAKPSEDLLAMVEAWADSNGIEW